MSNVATFILSTGRCGTQWIATVLGKIYADCLRVEHEPLHDRYAARQTLRAGALGHPLAALPPAVLQHLDHIENLLETQPYLECGHPNWSTLPYLVDRFPERIRIVHLTRHPVPTCYSWLTHGAFQPPLLPHLPEKILLSPFDEGIRFKHYQDRWDQLLPFEKCLFYWAEVHAFALDLETRLREPWLRLKYEDLFQGQGLQQLLEFLGLPLRESLLPQTTQVVDQYRYLTAVWQDWRVIHQHSSVIPITQTLSYDLTEINEMAFCQRYLGAD
jgi:hypothetical protein